MAMNELVAFGVIRSRWLVKLRTVPWRWWELRDRVRVQRELAERARITAADLDRMEESNGD